MQLTKVFDPLLVGRIFLSFFFPCLTPEEMRESPNYWQNKAEAQKYARDLGVGLTIWSTIDIIAALTVVFLSFFVSIPFDAILLFILFAVACPLIMALGIGTGCLRHLTLRETWTIVCDYFRT